jgi:2-succinyl-5-enolpyruvyl-6-hydroxy-3-cyclohexene-1-carboxylate synthase
MFDLPYHRPESWAQLEQALSEAWQKPGATVIEVVVNETDGAQTLQNLVAQVSQL